MAMAMASSNHPPLPTDHRAAVAGAAPPVPPPPARRAALHLPGGAFLLITVCFVLVAARNWACPDIVSLHWRYYITLAPPFLMADFLPRLARTSIVAARGLTFLTICFSAVAWYYGLWLRL